MAKSPLDRSRATRLLEPGPTVLITSLFRSHANVMTAAWLQPAGFDPPAIAISIHPGRLTHELVSKSEMFGVSIPTMDLLRAVHRCGLTSGRDQDKFEANGLTPIDPIEIEAPRIDECIAHLECGVLQRVTLTDHDLFIGEILTAEADSEFFGDQWVFDGETSLVHHVAAEYYAGLTRAYAVTLEDETDESRRA
jgi:flavin reductase (DIM6/NTAB) family NADH-FMN oxidoreductase RutF